MMSALTLNVLIAANVASPGLSFDEATVMYSRSEASWILTHRRLVASLLSSDDSL